MATTPQDAAKASAPNAQVTPQQPAQSTQSGSNGQAATPAASAQSATTTPAAPSAPQAPAKSAPGVGATEAGANGGTSIQPTVEKDGQQVNRGTAASDMAAKSNQPGMDADQKMQSIEQGRKEEQKVGDELDKANKDSDYFQQVANDDAVFNDPTRQEHRQMRAQEAEQKLGDPTRDPVAKQRAMDMNTPEPGAVEEAEEINKGDDPDQRNKQ